MTDVLEFAAERAARGQRVALLTVTGTTGSSPASPGQMMAVAADGGTAGTVGGGASEHALARRALRAIQEGAGVFSFSIDHAAEGMTCGGGMEGFCNVVGAGARIVIFGGGHVSQSLARLAADTGFAVAVVEERPEFAALFPDAEYVVCGPKEYGNALTICQTDYAVIATRGHATDADALRFCMGQPFAYVGMIGSKKKVTELFGKLRAEGAGKEELKKIYAPIGLDIAGGSPQEIAVAILAEVLCVKNEGRAAHKKINVD